MLDEVKNSIINAYQETTHLSRNKLSKLMEDETWMNAQKAIELGFADGMIQRSADTKTAVAAELFSTKSYTDTITNKLNERFHVEDIDSTGKEDAEEPPQEASEINEPETDTDPETGDTTLPDEETEVSGIDTGPLYDRLRELKDLF